MLRVLNEQAEKYRPRIIIIQGLLYKLLNDKTNILL